MGAITFEYGTSGVLQVYNRHTFSDEDGNVATGLDFIVTAASDAAFATAVAAAFAFAVPNKKFELKIGASTEILADPATNSGFLTTCRVTKVGQRGDTARSVILRAIIGFDTEPGDAARLGRRSATISIDYDAARMRTVTFRGVWTALETGNKTALVAYADNVKAWLETWIDEDNDGAGSPILTTTGRWQLIEETNTPEDENKRIDFVIRYKEVLFSSTPAPDSGSDARHAAALAAGIFLRGTFTRIDPARSNEKVDRDFSDVTRGGTKSTAIPSGISQTVPPIRIRFAATASIDQQSAAAQDPDTSAPFTQNAMFEDFIRPWVIATIKTMFGASGVSIDGIEIDNEDVTTKEVTVRGEAWASATTATIDVEERVEWENDARLQFAHVYSGEDDDYDLSDGGREAILRQSIVFQRLESPPAPPPFFGRGTGVEFLGESISREANRLDVKGGGQSLYTYAWVRRYLKVNPRSTPVPLVATPLGSAPGGSGAEETSPAATGTVAAFRNPNT